MKMSPADVLLNRLQAAYEAARDPMRAGAAAYMRNLFPFLGIPAPRQEAIFREITERLPHLRATPIWAWSHWACSELPERKASAELRWAAQQRSPPDRRMLRVFDATVRRRPVSWRAPRTRSRHARP